MKNHRISLRIRIIFLLIIIIISSFITVEISKKFPSLDIGVKIDSKGFVSDSSFSPDVMCLKIEEWVWDIDSTRINEGDLLELTIDLKQEGKGQYTLAGLEKNNLNYKLKEGYNSLGVLYYKENKIKFYKRYCVILKNPTAEEVSSKTIEELSKKYSGSSSYIPHIKRPSFVDSKVGVIILFITSFVMLGEFIKLIFHFVGKE